MTAGQVSDYTSAAALIDDLPTARWMLADRGSHTTSADTDTEAASSSCLAA